MQKLFVFLVYYVYLEYNDTIFFLLQLIADHQECVKKGRFKPVLDAVLFDAFALLNYGLMIRNRCTRIFF